MLETACIVQIQNVYLIRREDIGVIQAIHKIVAFFCFLRCGEFTVKQANTFDSSVHLCVSDVFFYENCALLKLKESKTDSFRKGIFIQLHKLQVEIFCKASPQAPLTKDFYLQWVGANIVG